MENKNIEGMVFIGWVLLCIALLFDDFTTHILIAKGFLVLETNPIKLLFDNATIFLFISLSLYMFIGFWFHKLVKEYRKIYIKKLKGYKWRDIFVFFYCLMLVFMVVMKITAGMNNINMMAEYMTDEGKERIDKMIYEVKILQQQDNDKYNELMSDYYNDKVLKLTYWQFIIISLGGFSLFKIGHKVSPWDLD